MGESCIDGCAAMSERRERAVEWPRPRLAVTAVLLCATVMLALGAGSAQALTVHKYLGSPIKEVPASSGAKVPGEMGQMNSMTVDKGDLWVAEGGEGYEHVRPWPGSRVDEFGEAGGFLRQLNESPGVERLDNGVATREAGGKTEVYVAAQNLTVSPAQGEVAVFNGSTGALLGKWTGEGSGVEATPQGSLAEIVTSVAVDGSEASGDWAAGDVYVTVSQQKLIDVFKPEAGGKEKYVTQIMGISPEGSFAGTSPSEPFTQVSDVAVDQKNGELLVSTIVEGHSGVDVLRPAPGLLDYELAYQIAGTKQGAFQNIEAITVNSATEQVYVANVAEGVIDQFSGEGKYEGRVTGSAAGPFLFEGLLEGTFRQADALVGIAVDSETGDLFVGDNRRQPGARVVDAFGPDAFQPNVVEGEATEVGPVSATLGGKVESLEEKTGEPATCRFVWGTSEAFGHVAPCEPQTVAPGPGEQPVEAKIEGLESGTTYYYRLQAGNGNGLNEGEPHQTVSFTTKGPTFIGQSAAKVTAETASLQAQLVPNGVPAYYYFQYGTESCTANPSACTDIPAVEPGQVPPRGALIGAQSGEVQVQQSLQELTPGATYYYRVVVESELEPGKFYTRPGPGRTFTTQPAQSTTGLPDGRQWELVSPPDKHGALIKPIGEVGVVQAAADGGAFTYVTDIPTESEPRGNSNAVQVFATRGSEGWVSRDIATRHDASAGLIVGIGYEYRFFSSDLVHAIVEPQGEFTPLERDGVPEETAPRASERGEYLRSNLTCESTPGSCYTPLLTSADVTSGQSFGASGNGTAQGDVSFVGANADASAVVLRTSPASSVALTAAAGDGGGLYEWSAGRLALVSVRPPGEGGPTKTALLGGVDGSTSIDARGAIAGEGSRVFWSAYTVSPSNPAGLYLWDAASGTSVRLDVPQAGAGKGEAEPEFQAANSEGSRVFFTDKQELTPGATGRDLYVCEIVPAGESFACVLKNIAQGISGVIPGIGEDGSTVYYVAGTGMYVAQESNGWTPRLVAVLAQADEPDWGHRVVSSLATLTSRVSPDGRYLAFMSERPLTGYDNRDAASGAPDEEVFLYDAGSGGASSLTCASCNPTGGRPLGVQTGQLGEEKRFEGFGVWPAGTWVAGSVPGWTPYELDTSSYQSRYLSNDGRMFFDSSDALVPRDVNHAIDVYESEPAGIGGCSATAAGFNPATGSCLGLISSGTSSEESVFLDASESGGEVFFMTASKLVPQDYDNSYDVYDAHECTATSVCVPSAAVAPPPCETSDACKPSPTPQPAIYGAPAGETFSGPENPAPPPATVKKTTKKTVKCRKGFVKKHGKCVKRPRPKRVKRAKKASNNRRANR